MSKKLSLSSPLVIGSVLAFVVTSGGTWGGYYVGKLNADGERGHAKVVEVMGTSVMGTVERVIDGDTVVMEDGSIVRLLGIDAPERNGTEAGDAECYASESMQALEKMVLGKKVELRKDIEESDRNKRLLRHVVIPREGRDNLLVSREMVEQGYAKELSIVPNKMYEGMLEQAQERARNAGRGLWSMCEYEEGETARLREKASAPPTRAHVIKGNISEKGAGRQYFLPGCPNYNRIKVDVRKGEEWFMTREEAERAGFSRSPSCDNAF